MLIRKAVRQDAKVIFDFIQRKSEFDREMRGFNGEVTTSLEKIENTMFGQLPFAYALLIEKDEQVLGFALYHFRYSSFSGRPSIWLDDLLVLSGERSQGFGEKLMSALMCEATYNQASHIEWTASPINTKAHEFYKRIGSKVDRWDGDRPFFRWDVPR